MKHTKLWLTLLTTAAVGVGGVAAATPWQVGQASQTPVHAVSAAVQPADNNLPNTPQITAKAAFLWEANSGTVLYAKDAEQRLPIASMTKVATLGVIYQALADGQITMDTPVTISDYAASMGGSQAFLDAGSTYTVKDLVQSIVVASANDSCVALAEHIAGNVPNFVEKMNQFARDAGATNTNFVNCTGLPATGAYSCARDMALMYQVIMRSPHYGDFNHVWLYDLTHPSGRVTGLTNTNKLIRSYPNCLGGKTGFTNEAGHCITVAARANDLLPIAVIIGAPDSKTRFNESRELLDYATENFRNQLLVDRTVPIKTVKAKNAVIDEVTLYPQQDFYFLTAQGADAGVTIATEIPDVITAPLGADTDCGKIYVMQDGQVLSEITAVPNLPVPAASYWQTVQKIVERSNLT